MKYVAPDLELQGAVVAKLKTDAAVNELAVQRVYDQPPPLPERIFPYISIGSTDTLENDADCIAGSDIIMQIDVWSRAVGFPECRRLTNAVLNALHEAPIRLPVNALVVLQHQQTRTMRDPDGLTSHAAMSFEALVERRPAPPDPVEDYEVDYSTEEQPLAITWIDGRTVYQKTVIPWWTNDQQADANGSRSWPHGIVDLDTVIDFRVAAAGVETVWNSAADSNTLFWSTSGQPASQNNWSFPPLQFTADAVLTTSLPPPNWKDPGLIHNPENPSEWREGFIYITLRYVKKIY